MKMIIRILFIAALSTITASLKAQSLQGKDTFVYDTIVVHTGEDLRIGKPASYDFINITKEKSGLAKLGKIANVAGNAGFATGMLGIQSGSVGTAMAGVKVIDVAGKATSIGMTADAIQSLNVSNQAKQIIGKSFRVLRFKKEGNQRRGEHIYAIVAGEGHTNYKIELAPALKSNEVVL